MDYLTDAWIAIIVVITSLSIGLLIGLNISTDRCLELENAAIVRNYAKLIVDENREVQFQWIEPETN